MIEIWLDFDVFRSLFWFSTVLSYPAGIYLLKVNNRNTRTCGRFGVFILNFEHVIPCFVMIISKFASNIKQIWRIN